MINMAWEGRKMRVRKAIGKENILLIAPHGFEEDDEYTAIMVDRMAEKLDASYVINFGWKRDDTLNVDVGFANCNDIRHCKDPAVSDFLDPVTEFIEHHVKTFGAAQILFIHGMSDVIRNQAADIDIVLGYGEGAKPRYTCDLWRKNLFCDMLVDHGLVTYEGKPGGKFSAHSKYNLTQAVCGKNRHGIQIEIVAHRRRSEKVALETADLIADAFRAGQKIVAKMLRAKEKLKDYQRRHAVEQI